MPVHCDGVVDEELNPHRRETYGGWAARAMRRPLESEEDVNRESSDDMPLAFRCHRRVAPNAAL